jgi:hypothetical protein
VFWNIISRLCKIINTKYYGLPSFLISKTAIKFEFFLFDFFATKIFSTLKYGSDFFFNFQTLKKIVINLYTGTSSYILFGVVVNIVVFPAYTLGIHHLSVHKLVTFQILSSASDKNRSINIARGMLTSSNKILE